MQSLPAGIDSGHGARDMYHTWYVGEGKELTVHANDRLPRGEGGHAVARSDPSGIAVFGDLRAANLNIFLLN